MDFNKKILDKIDNLVKLSSEFDDGFKIIFDTTTETITEQNTELLHSMTKKYISMRKEHGEIILMMNKQMNLLNANDSSMEDVNKINTKKQKKNIQDANNDVNNTMKFYDLSTFNTLLNNVNDLINNVDYEYKKIALKYPRFINNKQLHVILIYSTDIDNKYVQLIEELKINHPEHKYIIMKCQGSKSDIDRCEDELKDYGIKIKSKNLPLIYIVNKSTIAEIPISKIDDIEPIKKLIE